MNSHYHSANLVPAAEPPPKKRKLDYDAPEFKDINIPPSEFAKPANFQKAMGLVECEQNSGHARELYIHNRPIDFESVPVTLISPIFGRLLDDLFTCEKDLRSEDFAPARNLANMLSRLEKNKALRQRTFLDWLLNTLPGIERKKSSDDAPLQPHEEVRPRLATVITRGEDRDARCDHETDGHIELGDNLLLVTQCMLELGEGSTDPHRQLMEYVRAYYMQKRCSYRVGQSCLPVILMAYYGVFIPLVRVLAC